MQGFERFDREFLDTRDLWHLVPVGSVYRFWLRTAAVCFPMRCSPICSARGAARRYRVR